MTNNDTWLKVLEQRVEELQVKVNKCEARINHAVAEFREWIRTANDIDIVYDADWKADIVKDAHEKYKVVWAEFRRAVMELEEYKETMGF